MTPYTVSIVRYKAPRESVNRAATLCGGLNGLSRQSRVFVKPNIVYWVRGGPFPKWGVITTSRVVEDTIILLKDLGVRNITIGEGTVVMDPKDRRMQMDAYAGLGYETLKKRYGVRLINVFQRPFQKVDLGDGISLRFNVDILESDRIVNLPVLKTHAQTVISLGIKNLKGTLNIASRKACHNDTPGKNLHVHVSRLADKMPPIFTLLDGIYTNERGPGFDGRIRRSNLLIASDDILSCDMVGARALGYSPGDVPHLAHAARNRHRSMDLSDIQVTGESLDAVAVPHKYQFPYNSAGTLPLVFERMKIRGLSYRQYDLTLCTYCSLLNGVILTAVANAWKGKPWDDVEILTGKSMSPTPGRKKTILLGRCICSAHKNSPDIQEPIAVKGCPPNSRDILRALHKAGIHADPTLFENLDRLPASFMNRYDKRPEFDTSFFTV